MDKSLIILLVMLVIVLVVYGCFFVKVIRESGKYGAARVKVSAMVSCGIKAIMSASEGKPDYAVIAIITGIALVTGASIIEIHVMKKNR